MRSAEGGISVPGSLGDRPATAIPKSTLRIPHWAGGGGEARSRGMAVHPRRLGAGGAGRVGRRGVGPRYVGGGGPAAAARRVVGRLFPRPVSHGSARRSVRDRAGGRQDRGRAGGG